MRLKSWLSTFTSKRTRGAYASVVRQLFKFAFSGLSDDEAAEVFLDAEDIQIREWIDGYWSETLKERAPKTQQMYLSTLKTFLVDHDKELPLSYWRKFSRRRRGRLRPIAEEQIPTNPDLRKIFSHLGLPFRSFFAFQASAGTRISESLAIRIKDIDLSSDPPRALLRAETTKGGEDRIVFFTQESRDLTLEWLKVRDSHIETLYRRFELHPTIERKKGYDEVWPWEKATLLRAWRLALKKAALFKKDVHTGWVTMRTHTLRKRFRTQLAAVIPVDVIETLMGHVGYETRAYRRFTLAELGEFYKEGEHVLYLATEQITLKRLERQMRSRDERIEKLEEELKSLKAEVLLDEVLNAKDEQ